MTQKARENTVKLEQNSNSSLKSTTRIGAALNWVQYVTKGGFPLFLSLTGAGLFIFKLIDNELANILLLLLFSYVLYLYTAPIIKKPQDPVDEVLKLNLPLLWITYLWLFAAIFPNAIAGFTVISALVFGILLAISPSYFIPIFLLIASCYELALLFHYIPSSSTAYFHGLTHLVAALNIPRMIDAKWLIRSIYPRVLDIEELRIRERYFDPTKFTHSHEVNPIVNTGGELSNAKVLKDERDFNENKDWDSSPVMSPGKPLSTGSQRHDNAASDLASDLNTIADAQFNPINPAMKPPQEVLTKVTSLIKGYSPIQSESEIKNAVRAHNSQAIEFINRSLKVHLALLRQQLHVETAVLLWLRADQRQLEVRAVDTLRDEWTLTQFNTDYGILEEALNEPLIFNDPIEAHVLVPYYDQSLTIGGLLSMPVFLSDQNQADGVLIVDRGSNETWDQSDSSTLRIIAEKIALDIETSRLLRQVSYDSGQVERLCFSLRQLNEAFDLNEVAQCAVMGIGSYDGFDSATFFEVHDSVGLKVSARWLHPQIQKHYLSQPSLEVGEFVEWHDGPLFQVLSDDLNLSTLDEPIQPVHYINVDDYPLAVAASAKVIKLCDPVTKIALGLVLLTGKDDEVIQAKNMSALNILFEQVEVKLSSITAHERLKGMALRDGLTGLKNHMTFQSESTDMLKRAERDQAPLAFALIDIDHFKSVNDTYGHPFGDLVLQEVASTLQQQVRDVDLVARYGGEEFAMVLHATELEQAFVSVERVRQSIQDLSFDHQGEVVRISISVGLACYPIDSRDKERLIERADKALYQSKRNGRNQLTAWRSIAPEERDSSVGWTRHPLAFMPHDPVDEQSISSVLVPPLQVPSNEAIFDFDQMIPEIIHDHDSSSDKPETAQTKDDLALRSLFNQPYD